jgi:hypothetical protein
MTEHHIPAGLLSEVQRSLQPVRPLASPGRRALALLPLAIILFLGMPAYWGWLTHAQLAPWLSWGWSAVESLLGLTVLAAGFREAIPGRELSAKSVTVLILIACAGFALINTTSYVPPQVPIETRLRWLRECISMTLLFSIPALLPPAWLVSRALPNRPALTGALCGLGVGLMADAGLRLCCWDGGFTHIAFAHGGAVLLLTALAALSATLVERLKTGR